MIKIEELEYIDLTNLQRLQAAACEPIRLEDCCSSLGEGEYQIITPVVVLKDGTVLLGNSRFEPSRKQHGCTMCGRVGCDGMRCDE